MRIGITDYVEPPFDVERSALGPDVELVDLKWCPDPEERLALASTLDAVLVWHATIDNKVAEALTRCKVVVRYGVGYDNIDIAALEERSILFCNTPDYGTEEVADTAAAMILALHRKLFQYDEASRLITSGWQEHTLAPLSRARKTTVGVIGVGRIGTSVVRRLQTFGYNLVGFDPYLPSGHEKAIGYERATSLSNLLQQSDIVTIHCPLSDETRAMVDSRFLGAMKDGAILVNTARGPIVASLEVVEGALRSGKLGAVGLDVLPDEPPKNSPLIMAWRERADWLRGRFIINPHTAYFSDTAWFEMRYKAAETALMVLTGKGIRNRVPAPAARS